MKDTVIRLKFGKYRGRSIENIPKSYLVWLMENTTDALCEATKQEIRRVLNKWASMEKQKR